MVSFAEWLKALLKRHGLSQEAGARRIGVSLGTMHRWVNGKTEPRLSELRRIALAFRELPPFIAGKQRTRVYLGGEPPVTLRAVKTRQNHAQKPREGRVIQSPLLSGVSESRRSHADASPKSVRRHSRSVAR